MKISKKIMTAVFILASLVLYFFVLTAYGNLLVISEFSAISVCFLFVLVNSFANDKLLTYGMFFTLCADFCLVICNPIEQIKGVVFFLIVQALYGVKLYQNNKSKGLLIARIIATAVAPIIVFSVLGNKTDVLSCISVCYYVNLIFNIISAFTSFKKNPVFVIALLLFLLCDTVVGLGVAAGTYLPIAEGSFIHKIIFSGINLAWLFYLPSQVLISLTSLKNHIKKPQ
ncbi:MAG: hypothetical protein IKV36_03660 [Clostridia bacterium]|nr:hypothetical protein [Clostridia bacterium]